MRHVLREVYNTVSVHDCGVHCYNMSSGQPTDSDAESTNTLRTLDRHQDGHRDGHPDGQPTGIQWAVNGHLTDN